MNAQRGHRRPSVSNIGDTRLEEAGEYDITIEQGSGFSLPLVYEAPEGSPVDFTGATARMHVREKYSSRRANSSS